MLINKLKNFTGRRVLMLQGPIGPFFSRVSKELKKSGSEVYKINFNGGDFIFYPFSSIPYADKMENLEAFLKEFCIANNIEGLLVFNDCRPIHIIAKKVAKEMNLNFGVFEEGYIRPNFITFEDDGVNGHSSIPKAREFYDEIIPKPSMFEKKVTGAFYFMSLYALLYWLFSSLLSFYFNNSLHHRSLKFRETIPCVLSVARKFMYKITERKTRAFIAKIPKRYFLVALQVFNDTQIKTHYKEGSVDVFIKNTIYSFSKNGNEYDFLVIKHHPMDRGYREYSDVIAKYAKRYHITGRVFYVHDEHLPTLIDNALGCVVVNSTVGVSALHHGCPVKVCGNAFYDISGLTFQKSLCKFWKEAQAFKPNSEFFVRFKHHMVLQTQINGSFYSR